jgi:hypothetical protein
VKIQKGGVGKWNPSENGEAGYPGIPGKNDKCKVN